MTPISSWYLISSPEGYHLAGYTPDEFIITGKLREIDFHGTALTEEGTLYKLLRRRDDV
jgi:hypothetical protein